MTLSSIKSFTLELDGPADAAFTGGEVVSGQVVLELRRDTRVHSMKVLGRGVATAHWLENRGMNSVYNDYTSKITYFRKRQHLIRGIFFFFHPIHRFERKTQECNMTLHTVTLYLSLD
uniref:Arrestin-like N-terminal domain-containing protein n=1 Tax=Amphilophus citrinellus TaxID=61819 RepID=A0A3Q0RVR5_AMPCI